MGEETGPGLAWDQVEMLCNKGGRQSRGRSQLVPLMMGEDGRKCAGWCAWSDLYLAAVQREIELHPGQHRAQHGQAGAGQCQNKES